MKLKRDHFFGDRSFPPLTRAIAYRYGWKVGTWHKMDAIGRQLLRLSMRDSALEAVKEAKREAMKDVAA